MSLYIDEMFKFLYPATMKSGPTDVKIELISGFELFNTYPGHNYETWSNGWKISSADGSVIGEAEDLFGALLDFYMAYILKCEDSIKKIKLLLIRSKVFDHIRNNTGSFRDDFFSIKFPDISYTDWAQADEIYYNTHCNSILGLGSDLIPIKHKTNYNRLYIEKTVLENVSKDDDLKVIIIDDMMNNRFRKFNF